MDDVGGSNGLPNVGVGKLSDQQLSDLAILIGEKITTQLFKQVHGSAKKWSLMLNYSSKRKN